MFLFALVILPWIHKIKYSSNCVPDLGPVWFSVFRRGICHPGVCHVEETVWIHSLPRGGSKYRSKNTNYNNYKTQFNTLVVVHLTWLPACKTPVWIWYWYSQGSRFFLFLREKVERKYNILNCLPLIIVADVHKSHNKSEIKKIVSKFHIGLVFQFCFFVWNIIHHILITYLFLMESYHLFSCDACFRSSMMLVTVNQCIHQCPWSLGALHLSVVLNRQPGHSIASRVFIWCTRQAERQSFKHHTVCWFVCITEGQDVQWICVNILDVYQLFWMRHDTHSVSSFWD